MQIFNRIEPAENRRWHMQQSHHCNSYAFGKAVEVAVQAMGLQRRQPNAGNEESENVLGTARTVNDLAQEGTENE